MHSRLRRLLGPHQPGVNRPAAIAACLALAGGLLGSRAAIAAGFDTPILYTARHQGMGGTAIGYVDDPSAGFHNPAGLRGVDGLSLLGDFSLILGQIEGAPSPLEGTIESNLTVAPFFLAAAGYRAHPWLSVGAAIFPVASGGAGYEYVSGGLDFIDETSIVFIEATPFASVNVPADAVLPGELSIGAGWRASVLQFQRRRGREDNVNLDLDMGGFDPSGVRVGLQYQPMPQLSMGMVYRNQVEVTATADEATVLSFPASDGQLTFTLPSKLGFGAALSPQPWRFAVDVEYAFQSQNREAPLSGQLEGRDSRTEVSNIFRWEDGITARAGVELALGSAQQYPLRLGYIFDSQVTNPAYPSAFGTPPAPTHSLTAGAGYREQNFELNFAVAYRFGGTTISEDEWVGCAFCGHPGDYNLQMLGLYIDGSVDFEP